VILIDVKGDLPNLLLAFPSFEGREFEPWIHGHTLPDVAAPAEVAAQLAAERRRELESWKINGDDIAAFRTRADLRVLTPGSSAGEMVHILSSLERRSSHWETDPEASRAAVSAAISLVLRLLGKDPDPSKSREHVLLSVRGAPAGPGNRGGGVVIGGAAQPQEVPRAFARGRRSAVCD